jgi:membrane fusion protein (multidrug efflux system)
MRIPRTRNSQFRARAGRDPAFLALLLAVTLLLGANGCGDSPRAQSAGGNGAGDDEAEDAIAIELGEVARGTLSSIYATSATLRADKRATVTARTRGVIRELLVEEGDRIEKDQPLAILEDDEQRIAFEQASATYDTRRREYERAQSLHAQELLSDEEFEATRRQAVEAEHTTALAELTLSRTVIRATFGGTVLTRHLDVGATVNDGTPVYDIADLNPLYADVQVPERQVSQLRPGQTVRLATGEEASSGTARIERIAPAVDPETGTVKVTLAVRRAEGLRPGSFVRVAIVTDTHEDVLVVPRSALVAEGRRWHMFRIKEDDERYVERVEVTRGFEEAEQVEIVDVVDVERPLDVGDRIVVTGASSLDDGSAVKVPGATGEAADEIADEEEPTADAAEQASNPRLEREARGVAA